MCKFIKGIICLLIITAVVFFAIALWSGGEKFRWFGKKTGSIVEDAAEKLGNKADEIKWKKDEAAGILKQLIGLVPKKSQTETEMPSKKTSKHKKNGTESDEKETTVTSAREILKNIMEKLKSLI